jgi:hypothetical protein
MAQIRGEFQRHHRHVSSALNTLPDPTRVKCPAYHNLYIHNYSHNHNCINNSPHTSTTPSPSQIHNPTYHHTPLQQIAYRIPLNIRSPQLSTLHTSIRHT